MPPPPPPTLLGSPAQSCSRNLGLHLPDPPQPGGLHLRSPWRQERGLVCESRPGLAAQQGGVSQIREAAPNPACWVLQGSEPLIMNLIKGEQEPQSDLGVFSLTSSLLRWPRHWAEQVGCQACSSARAAGWGGVDPPLFPALIALGHLFSCLTSRVDGGLEPPFPRVPSLCPPLVIPCLLRPPGASLHLPPPHWALVDRLTGLQEGERGPLGGQWPPPPGPRPLEYTCSSTTWYLTRCQEQRISTSQPLRLQ